MIWLIKMRYVNLGCGNHCDSSWINIDIASNNMEVICCDLRKGISLPDNSCDVVYHSHLIEHLRKNEAKLLLMECFRVLKPGGIIRVAAPDLEKICRAYLETLEIARNGELNGDLDYQWMMLELYDQTVRENRGGIIKEYLLQNPLRNERFILSRIGEEGRTIINLSKKRHSEIPQINKRVVYQAVFKNVARLIKKIQKTVIYVIAGKQGLHAFEIGEFRLSGEVHQWMYDTYSMKQLLLDSGFINPIQQSADKSLISGFNRFHLDILEDGTVRKPDSFFMEAVKPEK